MVLRIHGIQKNFPIKIIEKSPGCPEDFSEQFMKVSCNDGVVRDRKELVTHLLPVLLFFCTRNLSVLYPYADVRNSEVLSKSNLNS